MQRNEEGIYHSRLWAVPPLSCEGLTGKSAGHLEERLLQRGAPVQRISSRHPGTAAPGGSLLSIRLKVPAFCVQCCLLCPLARPVFPGLATSRLASARKRLRDLPRPRLTVNRTNKRFHTWPDTSFFHRISREFYISKLHNRRRLLCSHYALGQQKSDFKIWKLPETWCSSAWHWNGMREEGIVSLLCRSRGSRPHSLPQWQLAGHQLLDDNWSGVLLG